MAERGGAAPPPPVSAGYQLRANLCDSRGLWDTSYQDFVCLL